MKLIDMHPEWIGNGGSGVTDAQGRTVERIEKAGVEFDCPCGNNDSYHRLYIPFANPVGIDAVKDRKGWKRTGDTFESMSLSPSILRAKIHGGCGWHGWLIDGELRGQIEG